MMHRLMNAASRHRARLTVVAFLGILVPLLVVVPQGEGSRTTAAVLLVLAAAGVLLVLAVNLSGWDPDAATRAIDVAPDPLAAGLFARWLRRSKHFRFVGGLVGGILGLSFADGDLTPILVGLLAGIAVGGALAEVHFFGRQRTSPRSADITVRRLSDYVTRTDTAALITISVAAFAMTAVSVADRSDQPRTSWSAVAALAAVLATAGMQWAVVVRRRPALSADLRRADDLMRRLAATQGFTRPAVAFALVMVSQGLATFGQSITITIVVVALWILALAWYVASRQSRRNLRVLIGS
jgi:hypothetical protein